MKNGTVFRLLMSVHFHFLLKKGYLLGILLSVDN